jgi:hypothetical protein
LKLHTRCVIIVPNSYYLESDKRTNFITGPSGFEAFIYSGSTNLHFSFIFSNDWEFSDEKKDYFLRPKLIIMRKSNSNRTLSVQAISGTYVNLLGINIEDTHKSGVLGFGIQRTDLTQNNGWI